MKPIRILSPNFDLLAEIDDYESLIYTRKWFKPGDFELRINLNKRNTDKLVKGNLIILGSDTTKVGIIRHREIELSEGGKGSEQLRIVGTTLGGILTHRVIVPPSGLAYDTINAQAETVMKHYVNNNAINPVDPARKIEQLVNATDQLRGAQIKREARYKNLSQELEEIGVASGLGWNLSVDYVAKKWVFDELEGRDLTHGNGVNPPVIFSPDYDSLQGQRYIDSDINYRNLGYVAGQGEGALREIIQTPNKVGYKNDWGSAPTNVTSTTINSVTNGILNVTSTTNDPMIHMYDLGSFDPNKYRYFIIRYRVLQGTAGNVELFFTNSQHSVAHGNNVVYGPGLVSDGQWRTIVIDGWTNANWKHSDITGWRYDWCTASGVTMELDYLMLVDKDYFVESGLNRFEVFIDARDIEDATLLPTRGEQRLAEFSSEQVLEGQILTKSPFKYEIDWNLGDTVTVQNRKWGVTLNARITEVREVYEPGGFKLSATFGNSFPTLIDKIKQEFRQVEGEIRK